MNKYTDEILKRYGINISLLAEGTSVPKLVIFHDDGYSMSYNLTYNNIVKLRNYSTDFIDDIIDGHLIKYVKKTRKKKLLLINEI